MAARLFMISGAVLLAAWPGAAPASADPWTLHDAADLPDWVRIEGTFRARYETLDGQYRVGRSPSDQLLSLRTTLLTEFKGEHVRAGLEVEDSRGYLADAGSSISTGEVDVFEPIQAYIGFDLGKTFGGKSSDLELGRFTLNLGSGRLVGRNNFRNTTNAFTGVRFGWTGEAGGNFTAFYTLPHDRRPADQASLLDNKFKFDKENSDLRFWGLYYERPKALGGVDAEVFFYGLDEDDSASQPTRNRRLYTPGVRLLKSPAVDQWDFDVEGGWQFGRARATTSPADTTDLDVSAQYLHAGVGRTFDAPWKPRIEAFYDYASGDGNPGDGKWTRFDSLYGPRRTDWGPSGIYGALSRVNISAPGVKLEVRPNARWDGFVDYRAVWLADDQDRFDRGGEVDPTGSSGSFVGNQLQVRARYWVIPKSVRLDFGGAVLFDGHFLKDAPNAAGNGDTTYGYADVTFQF